jgi:creatinine amidohydrolase
VLNGIDFGAYTREQLKQFANDGYTVVIPLAATEQHGPHLPVWTDTVICERICREAIGIATGAGAKLLMAPVLGIGCSEHHLAFGGTLSISSEVYLQILMDIGRSLCLDGFGKLVFVNGHGGNEWVMQQAAVDLALQYPMWTAAASYWNLAKQALADANAGEIGPVPGHAGAFEAAMMMALNPEVVTGPFEKQEHPAITSIARGMTNVFVGRRGIITGWDGYTDSPGGATKELGEHFFYAIARAVGEWLVSCCSSMENIGQAGSAEKVDRGKGGNR